MNMFKGVFRRKLTDRYLRGCCPVYWFDDRGSRVRYIGIASIDGSEVAIEGCNGKYAILRRCPSEEGEWFEWLGGIEYVYQLKGILKVLGI